MGNNASSSSSSSNLQPDDNNNNNNMPTNDSDLTASLRRDCKDGSSAPTSSTMTMTTTTPTASLAVVLEPSSASEAINDNNDNAVVVDYNGIKKKGPFHLVPIKDPEESGPKTKRRYHAPNSQLQQQQQQSVSTSFNGSERSVGSGISISSTNSGQSIPIPSLHGSLMRMHKNRDPHRYYEIMKVLGDGSMGSVSKVKKKKHAVGGSARPNFVKSEHRHDNLCFGMFLSFCPIICPIDDDEDDDNEMGGTSNNNKDKKKKKGRKKEKLLKPIDEKAAEHNDKYKFHRSGSSMVTYGHKDVTYALKSIHLDRVKDETFKLELMNEVAILQRLDHPHIVKAMETFDYHERLFLVLELCSGGDLYSRDPYDEQQACRICKSVLDAVAYMHSKKITHRDLKFENIMFSHLSTFSVKIIDFGLSKKYAHEEHLHDTVGTVYTMAPEVLKGDYDEKVDVWSVGVICFMLLSSSLPFYGKTRPHVVRKILNGRYGFKGKRWNFVSQKAKDFVTQTLVQNPDRRPSAIKALKHIWLDRDIEGNNHISPAVMDQVQASIQTFAGYGYLKKLALLVLGYKSSEEEIGILHDMFDKFDPSHDGEISIDDFRSVLTSEYDYTLDEIDTMFAAMDIDGTNKVHYSEFLAATIESTGDIAEERIAEAFDRLDSDDSGYITVENLRNFLGAEISKEYADSIIDEADPNHDHKISYEEFLGLWNEQDDQRNKAALKNVVKRRSTMDDSSIASTASTGSFETGVSKNSSDLGGGAHFFDVEKEKSMRGVWV